MDTALSICLGLGLSAACGFRVFVPLLVLGAAAASGHVSLAPGFDWLTTTPALVMLGVATAVEISAYYIPWLDNLLDTLATPASVVAGVLVAGAIMTDADPLFRWSIAAIAGGGVAGLTQIATVAARATSSALSAGLGNPLLATVELFGAVGLALVSLALPFVGFGAVVVIIVVGAVLARGRRQRSRRRATQPSSGESPA